MKLAGSCMYTYGLGRGYYDIEQLCTEKRMLQGMNVCKLGIWCCYKAWVGWDRVLLHSVSVCSWGSEALCVGWEEGTALRCSCVQAGDRVLL